MTDRNKIVVSAISGGVAGAAGGVLRKFFASLNIRFLTFHPGTLRSAPVGAVILAVFGAAGQKLYNVADAEQTAKAALPPTEPKGWLEFKYSPFKKMSDEDYQAILQGRLDGIDETIAFIDEQIERLRVEDLELAKQKVEQMRAEALELEKKKKAPPEEPKKIKASDLTFWSIWRK